MHPFLPFTVIPLAIAGAWYAAANSLNGDPARYHVTNVEQLEDPVVPESRQDNDLTPDIRVAAFLPHTVPTPPAPIPTLILNSVLTGSNVNLASINGRLVKEGDVIKGYRVVIIAADGVELTRDGTTRRLPMRPLHELPAPRKANTNPEEAAYVVTTQTSDTSGNVRSISEITQF